MPDVSPSHHPEATPLTVTYASYACTPPMCALWAVNPEATPLTVTKLCCAAVKLGVETSRWFKLELGLGLGEKC